MKIINAFNLEKNICNVSDVSLDELLNDVNSRDFSHIYINPLLDVTEDVRLQFTDEVHSVIYGNTPLKLGSFIAFDEKYYENNKERIEEFVTNVCRNTKSSYFTLNVAFINEENLRALSENPNIKVLSLGNNDEVYSLTKRDYDILRNSSINTIKTEAVDDELKDIYGEKIYLNNERYLVLDCNYEKLHTLSNLDINKDLTDEEIENLKYINDNAIINFKNSDNFENMFKIIKRLNDLGKNCKSLIEVYYRGQYNYKNDFNEYLFTHLDTLDYNVDVSVGTNEIYPIKEYVKYEKRLLEMIKPAMNLSPFEKYLYAYNIVKKFKKYRENTEAKDESRSLYKVMDGDYMVCLGYSTLLGDLLDKLGIESDYYSVELEVGLDGVPDDALVIPDDVKNENGYHARRIIHLVDPKYGIDGFYLSDPTWDNDMENDAYNYCLLSQDEYNGTRRYNYLDFVTVHEMYFVHSLEEFYDKANIWMNKQEGMETTQANKSIATYINSFKNNLSRFMEELKKVDGKNYEWFSMTYGNLLNMNDVASNIHSFMTRMNKVVEDNNNNELTNVFSNVKDSYQDIADAVNNRRNVSEKVKHKFVEKIIDSLRFFDKKAYYDLKTKYGEVYNDDFAISDEFFQQFMLEAGEYIVNKVNKSISGETLLSGIREMYAQTTELSEEELDRRMEEIREFNKKRQLERFPVRYNVLEDGTRVPVQNEINKFDIEEKSLDM